jgi:hypothetical protein
MQGEVGKSADFGGFGLTDQRRDMLWTWEWWDLKEDVKLHILLGGGLFLRSSGGVDAGGNWLARYKVGICGRNY